MTGFLKHLVTMATSKERNNMPFKKVHASIYDGETALLMADIDGCTHILDEHLTLCELHDVSNMVKVRALSVTIPMLDSRIECLICKKRVRTLLNISGSHA